MRQWNPGATGLALLGAVFGVYFEALVDGTGLGRCRYLALTRKQFRGARILLAADRSVVSAGAVGAFMGCQRRSVTNAVRITVSALHKRFG